MIGRRSFLKTAGAGAFSIPFLSSGQAFSLSNKKQAANQVYLVTSSYDMKSAVFDLEDEIMEEAVTQNPVTIVKVDLNEQKLWPWLGDLKNRVSREMPTKKAIRIAPD